MISLTPTAFKWISKHVAHRNQTTPTSGIRFGVRTTGCSGLAYVVEFVNTAAGQSEEIDHITHISFTAEDGSEDVVTVFISRKDIVYLDQMTVDHVTEGLNSGLKFLNPNERNQCGCGESFTV